MSPDGAGLIQLTEGDRYACHPTWGRDGFIYFSDDGDLIAIRAGDWKVVFLEQRNKGLSVWQEPFSPLRVPKLFNLRSDPFEAGDTSIFYDKWLADRVFVQVPIQAIAAKWLESFKEFPIRQKPASFNLDRVVEAAMPHP